MLELPKPPTDNLYKFVAVSGIALFLVGLVMSYILDHQEHDWLWKARNAVDSAYRETQFKTGDMIIREFSDENLREKRMIATKKILEANYNADREKLNQESDGRFAMLIWRKWYLFLTACCGVLTSIGGLALWYIRVQRHQDMILMHERTKIEREIASSPSRK